MITLQINPRGMDDEYLKFLNVCFGGWGDRQKFDWYFRRRTAHPETDLIILKQDNDLAACSAVTYRKVAFPNDGEVTVGIVTGACTHPSFRKQGYFVRLIEESVKLTAAKGAALLLGFVVGDGGSYRQMERIGSALFPCSYIFSTGQTKRPTVRSELNHSRESNGFRSEMFARLSARGLGYSRFMYASEQEFDSQFIHRSGETAVFNDDSGNCGIIERAGDTDILQLYLAGVDDELSISGGLAGLLDQSLSVGRKLFLYSSQPAIASLSRNLGLEVKAGYLTVNVASESRLRDALGCPEGAALKNDSQLAEAGSAWFLGSWNLQSGDRA